MYIHEIRYCKICFDIKSKIPPVVLGCFPHFSPNTKASTSSKIPCTELIKRSLLNRATIIMNLKMQAVPIPRLSNLTIFLRCK